MLPLKAVWIDSETDYVFGMKDHLKDDCGVEHLAALEETRMDSLPWRTFDIVLMDTYVNDVFSLPFIPKIRKRNERVPIIIVTRKSSKETCIEAINHGVHGWFEKTASPLALKQHITRFKSSQAPLALCSDRKAVFSQNAWVDLTSTEYKILEALKSAGRRLTRGELQSAVWSKSSISENNLDTHLTNLKRKIPELNQLLNVKRGLGYYLEIAKK